jgi:hypothetical protein
VESGGSAGAVEGGESDSRLDADAVCLCVRRANLPEVADEVDGDARPYVSAWHPGACASRNQRGGGSRGPANEAGEVLRIAGNGDGAGNGAEDSGSVGEAGTVGLVEEEFAVELEL